MKRRRFMQLLSCLPSCIPFLGKAKGDGWPAECKRTQEKWAGTLAYPSSRHCAFAAYPSMDDVPMTVAFYTDEDGNNVAYYRFEDGKYTPLPRPALRIVD